MDGQRPVRGAVRLPNLGPVQVWSLRVWDEAVRLHHRRRGVRLPELGDEEPEGQRVLVRHGSGAGRGGDCPRPADSDNKKNQKSPMGSEQSGRAEQTEARGSGFDEGSPRLHERLR